MSWEVFRHLDATLLSSAPFFGRLFSSRFLRYVSRLFEVSERVLACSRREASTVPSSLIRLTTVAISREKEITCITLQAMEREINGSNILGNESEETLDRKWSKGSKSLVVMPRNYRRTSSLVTDSEAKCAKNSWHCYRIRCGAMNRSPNPGLARLRNFFRPKW